MYSIGFRFVDPRDGLTYYVSIGSGFAAFYSGVLWTNAHVVEGLQEVLAEVAIVNPEPVAVRSGTGLGGDGTYVIVGNGWIHPEHRHGGISMLTPEQVHFGNADQVIAGREAVLREAWAAHPDRFVSGEPKPKPLPEAVWINPPTPSLTTQEIAL